MKQDLQATTSQFFELHWGTKSTWPAWDFSWNWSGPVPNYELGGLYTLFADEALIYVGLGASRGGGIYQDRGISRRLLAHVIEIAPKGSGVSYVPRQRWREASVTSIGTIGFPIGTTYLACALEDFLIGRLNPPKNSLKRSRNADSATE